MQPAWPQHRHTEFVWDCDAERSKGLTTVLPQLSSEVGFVHFFYLLSYDVRYSISEKNQKRFPIKNVSKKNIFNAQQ